MKEYIMSILGIVLFGVMIEVVVPSGSTSKYIKNIYSIFVLAVLVTPILKFFKNPTTIDVSYNEFEIDNKILSGFYSLKVDAIKNDIIADLTDTGLMGIEVEINYSVEDEQLKYNACSVNLKNLVITDDALNINKYETIKDTIKEKINLTDEEILFYE